MDVLADVIQSVRLKSQVYGRIDLTAPWGFRIDVGRNDHPVFHLVSRGTCWMEVDGVPGHVPLAGGDFVLLPRGGPLALRDRPETPAVGLERLLAESTRHRCEASHTTSLRYGGGGVPTSLINGCFTFEDGGATPLVEMLPRVIHVRGDGGEPVPWLASTLQFLAAESASTLPGSEMIRGRLADILFVQAIRSHLAIEGDRAVGWLRALTDPQIGRALRLLHERPGDPWTVENLASRVSMSRSSFADRFRSLVGIPPLGYLTRWRMHRAAQFLRRGDSTIAAVALAVGYESESSFGKVFRRMTGRTPGEFRSGSAARTSLLDLAPID